MYDYGYSYGYGLVGGNTYNPLINYDWSTTTAKEYKTDGVELCTDYLLETIDRRFLIGGTVGFIDTTDFISGTSSWRAEPSPSYVLMTRSLVGELPLNELHIVKFWAKIEGTGTLNISIAKNIGSSIATVSKTGNINGNWKEYISYVTATETAYIRLFVADKDATTKVWLDGPISIQKVIEEPNKRYLKDVGSTQTYNASMYFGRGAYLNGVDQTITVPINTTIRTALKRVNGIVIINETSQILTNYVISGLGVHKDYYLFTRLLTTAEKDSYTNTPEAFYAMAQADITCVLNMPMCETSSTVRNYKTGIDHPITNYTTSVRDNAKNLQYGLQTCKFVRDSLGVIQGGSDYLECDGVGYADTGWKPSASEDWTLEFKANEPTSDLRRYVFGNDKVNLRIDTNSNVVLTLTPDIYIAYKTSFDLNNNKYVIRYQASSLTADFFRSGLKIDTLVGLSISSLKSVYLGRHTEYNPPYNDSNNKIIEIFKLHNKALTNEEIQAL